MRNKLFYHSKSNATYTASMQDYIQVKCKRLFDMLPEDATIHCSCEIEKKEKTFGIVIRSKNYEFMTESKNTDFYDAVDEVADIAFLSLKKKRDKYKNKKKPKEVRNEQRKQRNESAKKH